MKSSEKVLGDSAFLERVTSLLTTDPQLVTMFPDPAVHVACNKDGLATEASVDALLAGYAERPAMGMRNYEIAADPETGRKRRQYLPSFNTVSYGD
ncbi:MAG: hypothetical protein QNK29_15885, partial [Desulfobacterales bacterium]|nr:hypothetical protein [Desulfobacterales bacterium]